MDNKPEKLNIKAEKKDGENFQLLAKIATTCKFDISILSCHEKNKVFLGHCFEKLNDKALFPLTIKFRWYEF